MGTLPPWSRTDLRAELEGEKLSGQPALPAPSAPTADIDDGRDGFAPSPDEGSGSFSQPCWAATTNGSELVLGIESICSSALRHCPEPLLVKMSIVEC